MRSPSNNCGRALVAALLVVAFFFALALSASPRLHQRIHPDADRAEHNCAVTMLASGSYNYSAHPPVVIAPAPAAVSSKVPALTPEWVESPFLGACIFEHAPPGLG
jgi:hypothetical protein